MILASRNRCTDHVCVFPMVVTELKLRDVQRQIFAADLVEASHPPAYAERFEGVSPSFLRGSPSKPQKPAQDLPRGYCWAGPHRTRPMFMVYISGTNNPYGIRSWKCRIRAASVLGGDRASLDDLQQTLDQFAVPQAEQAEIKV
jgi:hypothetical protein